MGINVNETNNNMDTMEMHTIKMSDLVEEAKNDALQKTKNILEAGVNFFDTVAAAGEYTSYGEQLPKMIESVLHGAFDFLAEDKEESEKLHFMIGRCCADIFPWNEQIPVDKLSRRISSMMSDCIGTFIVEKYK